MKLTAISFLAAISTFALAPQAQAASDYYMKIEWDRAAATTVDVMSWSWGATNAGTMSSSSSASGRVVSPRDAASGLPTGKRQHSPVVCRVDEDCDDLSVLDGAASVSNFTVTLDQASAGALGRCGSGTHFPKATITQRGAATIEMSDVTVSSCTVSPPVSSRAAQETGKRCVAFSQCPASSSAPASVTVTLTGQMRHTRTGHVTLMK